MIRRTPRSKRTDTLLPYTTRLRAGRTVKNRAAGLTVLELLITLTVASVLTSIAIPSYQRINAQNRLATSTNQLLMAMVSARQAAVTRNAAVTFCAGNPDDGCDGDWSAHRSDERRVGNECVSTGRSRGSL